MNFTWAGEPSRAISEIKFSTFDLGTTIQFTWRDGGGKACSATRRGITARRLIEDLTVVAVMGDIASRCYLVGLIRGLADMGDLDP